MIFQDKRRTPIEQLCSDEQCIIYIATRLFDIEEKIKAERLEAAVKKGLEKAADAIGRKIPGNRFTFVPFRDSNQEELDDIDKTLLLYKQDIDRLNRTILIVSYIDGLAKDEGICFELGFAASKGVPILLVSTDFISHRLPSGLESPIDPVLLASASTLIRFDRIEITHESFFKNLIATRRKVLQMVSDRTSALLLGNYNLLFNIDEMKRGSPVNDGRKRIFIDFGGELFEWQRMFFDWLVRDMGQKEKIIISHSDRYKCPQLESHEGFISYIIDDLIKVTQSDIVIICSDADECQAGSAFIQGLAKGLEKEIWLYNSKLTKIVGPGGYMSSRNLMIDYSATHTFTKFSDLLNQLSSL